MGDGERRRRRRSPSPIPHSLFPDACCQTPHHLARPGGGELPAVDHRDAVHQHVRDPLRVVVGVLERPHVASERTVRPRPVDDEAELLEPAAALLLVPPDWLELAPIFPPPLLLPPDEDAPPLVSPDEVSFWRPVAFVPLPVAATMV